MGDGTIEEKRVTELDQRISFLENRMKALENVVYDYKGIIPQLTEIKDCMKTTRSQLETISDSVDQIYRYRDQFSDAVRTLNEHDKLFSELRVSLTDILKIKEECSMRVSNSIDRIMGTLYGNGTPEKGLTAKLLQIEVLQKWSLRMVLVIIGLLLIIAGLDKFLIFAK